MEYSEQRDSYEFRGTYGTMEIHKSSVEYTEASRYIVLSKQNVWILPQPTNHHILFSVYNLTLFRAFRTLKSVLCHIEITVKVFCFLWITKTVPCLLRLNYKGSVCSVAH